MQIEFCQDFFMYKRITTLFLILIITLVGFTACAKTDTSDRLYINDSFSWMPVISDGSLEYAENHPELFVPFSAFGDKRLLDLTKNQYEYLWLKSEFSIPEYLKNKSLGLVISYLHYADKLWLNGHYIDGYGSFPPDEINCLYDAQLFNFPEELLNQDDTNTIYIKVYLLGASGISKNLFIAEQEEAKRASKNLSFLHSKIYVFFEGGLFSAFMVFVFFFFWLRKRYFFSFAMINLWTIILITPFFANEIPWFFKYHISSLFYMKFSLCCGIYFIIFYIVNFVSDYMEVKLPRVVKILKHGIFIFEVLLTLSMKSYNSLIKITPYVAILIMIQLIYIIAATSRGAFSKLRKTRQRARYLFYSYIPLFLTIIADIVMRGCLRNADFPIFTILGFQFTIIFFIYILSKEVYQIYNKNRYLNNQLKNEVQMQTYSLSVANEKLEDEMRKSKINLEMASMVQQKFMPSQDKKFRGWDCYNCYESCSVISGDLFDYYIDPVSSEKLMGAGIFDVSGHGLASGLITMLARDIIDRSFKEGMRVGVPMINIMNTVNDRIIRSKGDIDNYLTGILFNISDFNEKDECEIELTNAGHPYPILFHHSTGEVEEIKPSDGVNYYGALGMSDVDVSYSSINFKMEKKDILLCYTDGITEAMDEFHTQFGKQRLMKLLKENAGESAEKIVTILQDELKKFIGNAKKEDDITLLVFKREDSTTFFEEL